MLAIETYTQTELKKFIAYHENRVRFKNWLPEILPYHKMLLERAKELLTVKQTHTNYLTIYFYQKFGNLKNVFTFVLSNKRI